MNLEPEKQSVTIEVDPNVAVIAMGIFRGFMPSCLESLQDMLGSGQTLNKDLEKQIYEAVSEIYEKCIEKTTIREGVSIWAEILEMTGRLPDSKES